MFPRVARETPAQGGSQARRGPDPGRPAALRRAADVARWDDEADVLVVGFGAAGACAAIEARAAGADVLVLERASGGGGTSALSTGQIYLGGGTPIQKTCGFDDSPDEMYRYLEASCGPEPDRAKLRLFCDGCVDHYHWLVAQGVPFKPSFYGDGSYTPTDDCLSWSGSEQTARYAALARPAPRGHTVQQQGIEAGGRLMQALCAASERCGARILADALVETLVRDDARRVVGAVARVAGRELHLRARRGVVLCAGGFINDRAMVARHAPWLLACRLRAASDGDDGRGIRMGVGAGGEAIRMDAGCIVLPFTVPKGLLRGILVNRLGQRIVNEDAYQTVVGEVALRGHGGEVYLVLDDATFERPFPPTEIAAVGESVAELERELRMPEGVLQQTVACYNEFAARGLDPAFHKAAEFLTPLVQPPFAALDYRTGTALWTVFTMGGLRTGPDGHVLTPDGLPVEGLFAAGRTTSGLAAQGYSSGLSLADATFFGRRAGRAAAQATLEGVRP
jgi:succinate dehydrogenase/fumarate reductase flavoprotein subunit